MVWPLTPSRSTTSIYRFFLCSTSRVLFRQTSRCVIRSKPAKYALNNDMCLRNGPGYLIEFRYSLSSRYINVQKTQSKAESFVHLCSGGAAQAGRSSQPASCFSNPHQAQPGVKSGRSELAPNPSLQEGVKIFYLAACAATRLIHYTPPPFDDAIVPEDFNCCQAFAENS